MVKVNHISLQSVLKMTTIFTDARMQSNTPLSNCSLNDVLIELVPFFNDTLFQVVNIVNSGAVDTTLANSPHIVVQGVEVGWIMRPRQQRGELWHILRQELNEQFLELDEHVHYLVEMCKHRRQCNEWLEEDADRAGSHENLILFS